MTHTKQPLPFKWVESETITIGPEPADLSKFRPLKNGAKNLERVLFGPKKKKGSKR